jgi:carbon starvation protein CstA
VPLAFLTVSTMTAGVLNTFRYLSPAYVADKGATIAYIDGALSVILILLVAMVLVDSARRWAYILGERRRGVVNVPAVARDPEHRSPAAAAELAG